MWAGVQVIYHWGSAFRYQTLVVVRVKVRGNCHCCCAYCHLAISADGSRRKKKQQNQRDKLHPPANVWTDVKVGQRGNFSIISTASMLFSVKGDVQQGQPLM